MDENEIKQKLNMLAEFESQKIVLEMDKSKLLEEVKVPEEVQKLVSESYERMNAVAASCASAKEALKEEIKERLAMVFIPEEIQKIIDEIDTKRAEIYRDQALRMAEFDEEIRKQQFEIQDETKKKTDGIFKEVANRKKEIDAEFSGKLEAADENIKKLTDEIKRSVAEIGFTVTGEHYQAVYNKGKKSWIPQRLDKYTENHPDIKDCYTVGDPSVAIKRI